MLRNIQVGNLIQFREPDLYDRKWADGLVLRRDDAEIGIVIKTDIVMTQIYWQDGMFENIPTHDLNMAVNVEILV